MSKLEQRKHKSRYLSGKRIFAEEDHREVSVFGEISELARRNRQSRRLSAKFSKGRTRPSKPPTAARIRQIIKMIKLARRRVKSRYL